MATFYSPNTATRQPGSPEAELQKYLETEVGKLTANPNKRDIPGNLVPDFYSGKISFEELQSRILGSPNYDASKGPQINYGQGNQPLTQEQTAALAGGSSISDRKSVV